MKCIKIRIALLTFILGVMSVYYFNPFFDKWSEIAVDVPVIESGSPIIVDIYPTKRFPMRYEGGGGGGSGGETCEDFIKSLGKLTKQSRRILAYTPCRDSVPY